MAPKTGTTDTPNGKNIAILCNLIMSCEEFKANTAKMTEVLGITHTQNVPRAINSIIGPHGFELKGGKVIKKDGTPQATASATTATREPTATKATNGHDEAAEPPKKKARTNGKNGKTNAPKKRKIDVVEEGEDGVDSEAA